MSLFSDEAKKIAGESVFTYPELQKLFKTPEEQEEFLKVRKVVETYGATNESVAKLAELGTSGLKILAKVAKYALTI